MKSTILIIALSLALLSGCSYFQKSPPEPKTITAGTFMTIVGVQWILEEMTVNGQAFDLTGEKPFFRIDDDKKISGFGSVNRFFGRINIDDDGNVSWPSPLGSTQMAGPPEMMKQEQTFMQALTKTEQIRKSGIRLHARSKDGKTELVFYVPVE